MTEILAWQPIAARLAEQLGEPIRSPARLGPPRQARATWAIETTSLGQLVVKARRGDRADEKTRWCAANLPRLAERGYPVPEILWHDFIGDDWHVVVQPRLPGKPLRSLKPPLLEALLAVIELQRDAGIAADERTSPLTRRSFSSRVGTTSGETQKAHRQRPTNFAAGSAAGSNQSGDIAWRRLTSPTTI